MPNKKATIRFPNACELDMHSKVKVLVWENGQRGKLLNKTWSQSDLYYHAQTHPDFRVAKIPINSKKLVEIYQRDIFPPEEQAAYAHYPNQGNCLAAISLDSFERRKEHLFLISQRWANWTCCKCDFNKNKYEAKSFQQSECEQCHRQSCAKCLVDSVEPVAVDSDAE